MVFLLVLDPLDDPLDEPLEVPLEVIIIFIIMAGSLMLDPLEAESLLIVMPLPLPASGPSLLDILPLPEEPPLPFGDGGLVDEEPFPFPFPGIIICFFIIFAFIDLPFFEVGADVSSIIDIEGERVG